jgi:hypothetical protein
MRIIPIVNQLAKYLPSYTQKFTTTFNIIGATQANGTATITTQEPHNLSVGAYVGINGIVPYIPITELYPLNQSTTDIEIKTTIDNALTSQFDFKLKQPYTITPPKAYLYNSVTPALNGGFDIIGIPNRYTAQVSGPTGLIYPIVELGYIEKYAYNTYNGVKTITAVQDSTMFSYTVSNTEPTLTNNSGTYYTTPRIAGCVNLDRAIKLYTAQNDGNYWMFVSPAESLASKDPYTLNDGLASLNLGVEFRQKLIDSINIDVFMPTTSTINAATVIDDAETIKIALFKSLLRFTAAQQYNAPSIFQMVFDSSFLQAYEKAYLIYRYTFQTRYDVTYYDTFNGNEFYPFRDIIGDTEVSNNQYLWNVNLDQSPDET